MDLEYHRRDDQCRIPPLTSLMKVEQDLDYDANIASAHVVRWVASPPTLDPGCAGEPLSASTRSEIAWAELQKSHCDIPPNDPEAVVANACPLPGSRHRFQLVRLGTSSFPRLQWRTPDMRVTPGESLHTTPNVAHDRLTTLQIPSIEAR